MLTMRGPRSRLPNCIEFGAVKSIFSGRSVEQLIPDPDARVRINMDPIAELLTATGRRDKL